MGEVLPDSVDKLQNNYEVYADREGQRKSAPRINDRDDIAAEVCSNPPMRHFFPVLIFLLAFFPSAGQAATTGTTTTQTWIGSELHLQEAPKDRSLLLYQGNINSDAAALQTSKYASKGLKPRPILKDRKVTLMYKIFGVLPEPEFVLRTYAHRAGRWSKYKANVEGIQIDYDATPAELIEYTAYLTKLRETLTKTSIAIAVPVELLFKAELTDLKILSGAVSEMTFKIYKGAAPLPNLGAYPKAFEKVTFPFKVGLITGSETPDLLTAFGRNPNFRGVIYYPGITKQDE